MTMTKITATQRAALVAIRAKKAPLCGWGTMIDLQIAGLIVEEVSGAFALTVAGEEIASAEAKRLEEARTKRNRAARGRNAALRSLGLKRTPYGWE